MAYKKTVPPLGISVIVCCYNSEARLPLVMEHLARQVTDTDFPWEVILVNNKSTDGTAEAAAGQVRKYPGIDAQLTNESKPGLTYARIRGADIAKYSYLLFCDDDNLLQPDYLHHAWHIMTGDAQIGAASGIGSPVVEGGGSLPDWFAKYRGLYATGPQHPEANNHLYGAGLLLQRDLFLRIYNTGYPFICEDRKGNALSSGGDTEICYIIRLLGYKLHYDARLRFDHLIIANRLTTDYLERLQSGIGYSFVHLLPYRYLLANKHVNERVWLKDTALFTIRMLRHWFTLNTTERTAKLSMLKGYWRLRGKYAALETRIIKALELMKSHQL